MKKLPTRSAITRATGAILLALIGTTTSASRPHTPAPVEKLTFHGDPQRTGWNARETVLTPASVAGGHFGLLWQTPQLDSVNGVPPLLFASPLYVPELPFASGPHRGQHLSLAYVVTSAGYAYAINTRVAGSTPAGAIIWRKQLTERPCGKGTMGNLSTPVIDRTTGRLYVTSCSGEDWDWHVHALDLQTGAEASGWPTAIDRATMNVPGLNRNGTTKFIVGGYYFQRGALNLSGDGSRLYVAFGPDTQGWLVSVDTRNAKLASAFSTTSRQEEEQGGMWGAGGPSVDRQGRVHIATGANFSYALAKRGIPGVFPDSAHSWGQSILQFTDETAAGMALHGTYTPYNYCQTAAQDIDIAGSGTVSIDLAPNTTSTPHLLALGGKQGNLYLVDRDHMPGGTEKRHPCSTDARTDGSLLAPDAQPVLNTRGPLNVFGPFSDNIGMTNSAKSRSTPAWFHDASGGDYLFLSGSAKTGADFGTNVPPGLIRAKIVTAPGKPAFLRIDGEEMTQTLQNPGSPFVSSNAGRNAVIWLLDTNAPRTMDLFQPGSPRATLYAFDALTFRLLWKSSDELFTSGKYNEPAIVNGLVLVGTDRLQAFGLHDAPVAARSAAKPAQPVAHPSEAPKPAPAAANNTGEALFDGHCAGCHRSASAGAPPVAMLQSFSRERIVTALTTGKMKYMAADLSPGEIQAITTYLKPASH
jgi:mono/diheme cytochrome c family protein